MATLRNSLFNNAYEQICEEVHAAITKFKNTKYPTLHVLDIDDWGQDLSLRYSRTHAFTIKYGYLIEKFIIALLNTRDEYTAWELKKFPITREVQKLVDDEHRKWKKSPANVAKLNITKEYNPADFAKNIQLDCLVLNRYKMSLNYYEIKTAGTTLDDNSHDEVWKKLMQSQCLLKSHGNQRFEEANLKFKIESAKSFVYFSFGESRLPRELCLIEKEIDQHFGFPIYEAIEKFREIVFNEFKNMMEDLEDTDKRPEWKWPIVVSGSPIIDGKSLYPYRSYSFLKLFGYSVGKKGWSDEKRQDFLSDFMEKTPPSKFTQYFDEDYGEPCSEIRLKKIIDLLNSFIISRENASKNYKNAIEDWSSDITFLKKKYARVLV
tara:strand:- start:40 stop:1173 length:1134 start_codon:yes stop_codon:yes gene_type:complete